MTKIRAFPLLLALLLTAGLIAACGGDDEDPSGGGEELSVEEYSSTVDDELSAFNTEFAALGQEAANPESREAYAAAVTDTQARVTETVDTLEGIEPPAEAADFHQGLIDAMTGLEESFTPVIDAAEGSDDQALLDAASELQEQVGEFTTAANELAAEAEDAGIEVPSLTGPSS